MDESCSRFRKRRGNGKRVRNLFVEEGCLYGLLAVGLLDVRAATSGSSDGKGSDLAKHESWRDRLADQGVTFSAEWDANVFANVRGGIERRAETDGLIKLGLDLDFQKITKLCFFNDTDIHVEGYYPYGTNISAYVGDLPGVNNDAAYNSPRLYELWAQKGFTFGIVDCSVRTGLLAADQEFYLNNTADWHDHRRASARHPCRFSRLHR
jgi:carbohydrate-selective porin OprB